MTTAIDRSPAALHAAASAPDDLLVAMGLLSGTQLRGRLARRGAEHVLDRLNNWNEPLLQLETAAPDSAKRPRTIVARSELAWVYLVQAGAGERWPSAKRAPGGVQAEGAHTGQVVLVQIGAFEVRGTPQVVHQIDWPDYLLACSSDGRFFALADAHVSGPATDLQIPVLAVNAARVAALMTLD
jgi:hypothetical protein